MLLTKLLSLDLLPELILVAVTAGLTWLTTSGKNKADIEKIRAEKNKLENERIQGVIDMWQELVETLTQDVKELTHEVEALRKENKELKRNMETLEKLLKNNSINT